MARRQRRNDKTVIEFPRGSSSLLFARASRGEIAGARRRFAVDKDVARATNGDAAAVGPVAEHGCRPAVDEHVLGTLDDGPTAIGGIALARRGLPANRRRRAAPRN